MMKLFKAIVFLVVLLAIVAGAGVFFLDSIIKTAVNRYGSEVTQTEVKLGGVSTSIVNVQAGLSDLFIGSPKGFSAPYVFKLGKIGVDVDRSTLMKDVIVINRIEISDVGVAYELVGTRSNLSALSDNIARYAGSSGSSGASGSSQKSGGGPGKKILIKELSVTGAEAILAVSLGAGKDAPGASKTLKLPNLTLRNIGDSGKGIDFGPAMAKVLDAFTEQTIKAIAASPLKDAAAQLSGAASAKAKEAADKAKEAADKAAGGLVDSINKSLFK